MASPYAPAFLLANLKPDDLIMSDGAQFRVGWSNYDEPDVDCAPGWSRDPQRPWLMLGPSGDFAISVTEISCADPHELEPYDVEKWWSLQPATP